MEGYVVKEKLKMLKEDLKKWNQDTFGEMNKNIQELKDKIQELDILDDSFGLEELEIIRRKEATANLFQKLNQRNSLNAQKAKIKWLQEGDVNSNFFHRAINFRRKRNELVGITLNGVWNEEVEEVKKGVRDFFKNQFSKSRGRRPSLREGISDKKISEEDNRFLIADFSEQEVLAAISSCDCSKSPGPDGFNFKFIKECWHVIREEFFEDVIRVSPTREAGQWVESIFYSINSEKGESPFYEGFQTDLTYRLRL